MYVQGQSLMSYDVILASNALATKGGRESFLGQCKLLLCKGGVLVLNLTNPQLASCMDALLGHTSDKMPGNHRQFTNER